MKKENLQSCSTKSVSSRSQWSLHHYLQPSTLTSNKVLKKKMNLTFYIILPKNSTGYIMMSSNFQSMRSLLDKTTSNMISWYLSTMSIPLRCIEMDSFWSLYSSAYKQSQTSYDEDTRSRLLWNIFFQCAIPAINNYFYSGYLLGLLVFAQWHLY